MYRKWHGKDMAWRYIKYWCVEGHSATCRLSHRDLELPQPGDLPSLEELNKQGELLAPQLGRPRIVKR